MPVWLRNLQSSIRFCEHLLRLQSNFILGLAGAARYDVSVVCVESESIRNLNRVYRRVDQATDVLAFPYHEVWESDEATEKDVWFFFQDTVAGVLPAVKSGRDEDYNLGDVILGMSVISEECKGVRLEQRLPAIFTHGLCHLLGYRHDNPTLSATVSGSREGSHG